ncbi:hypothetical protein HCN44_009091 [Aphidius gifuensis]|uniref:Uncharacterized protein n=1 Tax=Aphidius gifuensis TaxID=684658 RepID=A0A834XNT2_APHGI|nr:hypothetical protein HCN44_009091 [Aphidius gifuensis]
MNELFDIIHVKHSKNLLTQAQCEFLESQRQTLKRGFISNDSKVLYINKKFTDRLLTTAEPNELLEEVINHENIREQESGRLL